MPCRRKMPGGITHYQGRPAVYSRCNTSMCFIELAGSLVSQRVRTNFKRIIDASVGYPGIMVHRGITDNHW